MSNLYSLEPKTNGKVNINTTHGLLSVELWGKECPLACRNFIQLCLEGYYDQSTFHRLVPGFCLQGGKPEKRFSDETDENGAAIFPSGHFPVETHSRLKFNRRGLLGMVVLDQNDTKKANGSQFFFTLSEAPELNGRATLFGRIVGDTIFNLLRMGELETDPRTETPLYPPRILSTDILQNPFNDIIPRERILIQQDYSAKNQSYRIVSLKKKNTSLLSFAEDEVTEISSKAYKSNSKSFESLAPTISSSLPQTPSISSLQFLHQMKSVQMKETQNKIKAMEEELGFRFKKESEITETASKGEQKTMTALEKHKSKFTEMKKRKAHTECKDEIDTLLLLNSFRRKIQKTESSIECEPTKKHLDICKLHGLLNCLSCKNNFNINLTAEIDDLDEKDWMMHKLVFDRREFEGQVREDLNELVVIDPREQAKNANSTKKSLFLFSFDINNINSTTVTQNQNILHSNCQGLSPVYNNQGILNGYRGTCHVSRWNGSPSELDNTPSINSKILNSSQTHDIFQDITSWFGSLFGASSPTTSYKNHGIIQFKQTNDNSLFDWLSPHHDIIRNHPHYRQAHFQHRHCIHKKHTGLFEFLGNIFGLGSGSSNYDNNFTSTNDPYSDAEPGSRCLNPQFYADNPFRLTDNQYDPHSVHLAHRIHNLKRQINNPLSMKIEDIKNDLYKHYDRLYRHLDCHCHHELPRSRTFSIHHRPIGYHSINMISQPAMNTNSSYPFQMNASVPFDPSMDMENEHVSMLRMSGLAAQKAYNMGYFMQNPELDSGALRMQVFHPVNTYGQNYDDHEWNRLKVEKVIVIKRLKIPVVRSVPVPVPVPVPYPVPSPTNLNGNIAQYSELENIQPGYMGNNTYMVDSINESPSQINNVVQAISGAPCECLNKQYLYDSMPYGMYSPSLMENEYPGQNIMNSTPIDNYGPTNPVIMAHAMAQPGIQISPNPRYKYRKSRRLIITNKRLPPITTQARNQNLLAHQLQQANQVLLKTS